MKEKFTNEGWSHYQTNHQKLGYELKTIVEFIFLPLYCPPPIHISDRHQSYKDLFNQISWEMRNKKVFNGSLIFWVPISKVCDETKATLSRETWSNEKLSVFNHIMQNCE